MNETRNNEIRSETMSAFEIYIEKLVAGEDVDAYFPKNESSWEELFDFASKRITEIIVMKRELAALEAVADAANEYIYLMKTDSRAKLVVALNALDKARR